MTAPSPREPCSRPRANRQFVKRRMPWIAGMAGSETAVAWDSAAQVCWRASTELVKAVFSVRALTTFRVLRQPPLPQHSKSTPLQLHRFPTGAWQIAGSAPLADVVFRKSGQPVGEAPIQIGDGVRGHGTRRAGARGSQEMPWRGATTNAATLSPSPSASGDGADGASATRCGSPRSGIRDSWGATPRIGGWQASARCLPRCFG
jgi:hypothetical protein